jgi:hypothetical protein
VSGWEFDGPAVPDDFDSDDGFDSGFGGDAEDLVDLADGLTDVENEK